MKLTFSKKIVIWAIFYASIVAIKDMFFGYVSSNLMNLTTVIVTGTIIAYMTHSSVDKYTEKKGGNKNGTEEI